MADNDELERQLEWLARLRQKVADGSISFTATAVEPLVRPVVNYVASKASRESALHRLVREIHEQRPNISRGKLIERLRREKGNGVIADVDNESETVSWAPTEDAALRDASFKSIGEMLSRIRRELRTGKLR